MSISLDSFSDVASRKVQNYMGITYAIANHVGYYLRIMELAVKILTSSTGRSSFPSAVFIIILR